NFVLSELTIAASSTASPDKFEPVRIESAAADYSQANYHISLAIDGKIDRSGWAVDGNTKFDDRVATFRLANPLLPDTIARVRVQLHHRYGGSHHIGRLRFALARGELRDFPAAVTAALLADAGKRNETQRAALSEYLISERGSDAQRTALRQLETARRRRGEVEKTPATMVMAELPQPRTTRVLFRGEYDKPREAVTAGTPSALPPMPDDAPRNRLGLARWLTAPDHPLTSRVFVNRVWQRLFGVGIVATLEDFGSQGDWPSHPELLDWLAVDFVESGWNVKALHKRIAMSATYRQSSRVTADQYDLDPDNRLLARGPRFRLDAEVIRDSALFVSGQLVEQLGGPSVFPYHPKGLWQEINNRPGYSRVYKQDVGDKLYRRSLYTFWKRTVPPPSMSTFDAPEREFCVVRRARTNTPLQAIVMLHDPQFVEAGRALGARMLAAPGDSTDDRLTHGFRLCFARRPEPAELAVLSRILTSRLKQYRADVTAATAVLAVGARPIPSDADRAELAAWSAVGRVLLNLSEFVTKE
ncbi:MAG: DUF1553 domain-containing protein, partial [Pirellulaceae bacterium]|nr:DUF1553 domain-containing protein [Pirellulaceae bacterium]